MLGLEHLLLGYAGFFSASHPIHASLAALKTGDSIELRREQNRIFVFDQAGSRIASLSKAAAEVWTNKLPAIQQARVFAIVRRDSEQDDNSDRRERYQTSEWEVPIPEIVLRQRPA